MCNFLMSQSVCRSICHDFLKGYTYFHAPVEALVLPRIFPQLWSLCLQCSSGSRSHRTELLLAKIFKSYYLYYCLRPVLNPATFSVGQKEVIIAKSNIELQSCVAPYQLLETGFPIFLFRSLTGFPIKDSSFQKMKKYS